MSLQPQIELVSMLTALYCDTMIQAEICHYFRGEHAQTQLGSNFEITKCCGYLEF